MRTFYDAKLFYKFGTSVDKVQFIAIDIIGGAGILYSSWIDFWLTVFYTILI